MTDSVTSKTKNIFVLTESEPVYTKKNVKAAVD